MMGSASARSLKGQVVIHYSGMVFGLLPLISRNLRRDDWKRILSKIQYYLFSLCHTKRCPRKRMPLHKAREFLALYRVMITVTAAEMRHDDDRIVSKFNTTSHILALARVCVRQIEEARGRHPRGAIWRSISTSDQMSLTFTRFNLWVEKSISRHIKPGSILWGTH